jgi:hypothetical protein
MKRSFLCFLFYTATNHRKGNGTKVAVHRLTRQVVC